MPESYKFPDEVESKDVQNELEVRTEEDDIELEVVDDTPEEDRGRKPLEREVNDPTDEEVAEYSEKVQKRMRELTHARHDERRAKESALREREEAARVAEQLLEENRKLREQFNAGAVSYNQVVQSQAEMELQMARQKLRAAQESYDTDQIIAAQEELAAAKFKAEAAKSYRPPTLQQPEKDVYVTPTQQQPVVKLREIDLKWQEQNPWFGTDDEMTALGYAVHKKLVEKGIPAGSPEYYERVDARMREVFPDYFGETKKETREVKRPATVVAAPTRTAAKKTTVTLTKSQEAIARRLGLTNKQYATEVLKLNSES
jgi:hypothetical protein